ncbi:hypothetical protein AB0L85_06670 [Streptomyces sp. NPDC052051]|uniref:hypothetical protein n=1 Tax=Streptomyces sp. NPDC052051 TaxID=3154649 RepID=UPI003417FBB2
MNDDFMDNPWEAASLTTAASTSTITTKTVTATPRRLLKATYDVKETWSRLLIDEFGPGGYLAENAQDFGREHLLWALTLCRHVNGRTGEVFISNSKIAERLGYNGNNHPGTATVRMLTKLGLMTENGKKGRAKRLRLSAPVELLAQDKYELLLESVVGETITTLNIP